MLFPSWRLLPPQSFYSKCQIEILLDKDVGCVSVVCWTFYIFQFHILCEIEICIKISGFQTWENNRTTRPAASWFQMFSHVWKLDETRSTSFWNDFSKETIHNYAVLYYSHFSLNDLLYSVGIHFLWAFVFNYPIVSRCTKFVFQKRCELEVICILFLPWPKEAFVSRKVSRKKNFAWRGQYRSLPDIKISGQ